MTKNTIGQFIAALRKANGMTQQDVADRLNVSNKAVSRWERDECAPDISLLPAIAEMFGITCDELLKGERIFDLNKKDLKVDKQMKLLVTKTIRGFKTLNWIAMAVASIGLIFMFCLSYGFYQPVIGFFIMLLFEIISFVIVVYSISRTKDIKTDNELFEMVNINLNEKFNTSLSNTSFHSFFIILSVIMLSLPFILFESPFVQSVLSIYSYTTIFLGGILLILTYLYLKMKPIYAYWIIYNQLPTKDITIIDKQKTKMNRVQNTLTLLASFIFIYGPYLQFKPNDSLLFNIAMIIGILCLLTNIIYYIVILIKRKNNKNIFILNGVRNILFIPASLLVSKMHYIGFTHTGNEFDYNTNALERYDVWHNDYLTFAIIYIVVIYLVFAIVEMIKIKENPKCLK